MMARKLDVYLREVKIGVLGQDTNANLSFTYNEDYRQLKNAQAIS
ncbi:MAG: HipA-like protein, partial [Porticoccaceae bacterium]